MIGTIFAHCTIYFDYPMNSNLLMMLRAISTIFIAYHSTFTNIYWSILKEILF